jgi:hypothetical protein
MAYPQGMYFRATDNQTDPSGYDALIGSPFVVDYPTTTAQGNVVGWEDFSGLSSRDRDQTTDVRLKGFTFFSGADGRFRMDLPSAGSYTINLALGDSSNPQTMKVEYFDGTTSLDGGPFFNSSTSAAGHWIDATGVERTSESDWVNNNAAVTKTFATTIFRIKLYGSTGTPCLNTIYVASAGGGATNVTLSQNSWPWTAAAVKVNSKTQLTLGLSNWAWSSFAVAVNLTTRLVLAFSSWAWTPAALSVNAKTALALALSSWLWTSAAMKTAQRLTLGQSAWSWTSAAIKINARQVLALAQNSWAWTSRALTVTGGGAAAAARAVMGKIGIWLGIRI